MAVYIDLTAELLEDGGLKYDVFFAKLDEILISANQEHLDDVDHVQRVRAILNQKTITGDYGYGGGFSDNLIEDDEDDEEYLAYNQLEEEVSDHTLATNYSIFCDSLYNTIVPRNTPIIDIERRGSRLLEDLGIPDFVNDSNYCWVNIIDATNEKHKINAKYNKAIRESTAFGRSGGYHLFRADDLFVDVRLPGVLNVKRTPLDAPRDSQVQIVKDYIDYSLLQADPEVDQDLLEALMPGQQLGFQGANRRAKTGADVLNYNYDSTRGDSTSNEYPFGTLPVHIIYIPYFYCYSEEENEFGESAEIEYKKLALWVVFDADFKPRADREALNGGKPHVILKARLLETHSECEIVECNFSEVLPMENYSRGLISEFFGDHALLNTMRVGLAKIADYISDPAWQAVKRDAMGNSSLPFDRIESGALYDQGFDFKALIADNIDKQLMALKDIKVDIKGDIQDSTAVNPTTAGNMPSKISETAAAVNTRMQRFDVRIEAPSRQFDDEFIKSSHYVRISMSQSELRKRIQDKLEMALANPEDPNETPFQIMNRVLDEDDFFRRLMDYSGLEFAYREFFEYYNKKRDEEQSEMSEFEALTQEYLVTLAMSQRDVSPPIVPEKQTDEQGNAFFIYQNAPVEWSDKNINRVLDDDLTRQEQEKAMQLQKANEIRAQIKMKEKTFEGLPAIPAPNNLLYFEILTDPIEDTDLTVIGSDTVLHRKERIENSDRLAGMANARPEFNQELNWKGGLKDVARAMGLKLRTWFKTEKQKQRDEIQMRQQMAEQQQMGVEQQKEK